MSNMLGQILRMAGTKGRNIAHVLCRNDIELLRELRQPFIKDITLRCPALKKLDVDIK